MPAEPEKKYGAKKYGAKMIAEAELEEDSDRIRIVLADGQANGGMIAEIIVNGRLQLTGLEEDEMDLEDVFLQVTRGETQ